MLKLLHETERKRVLRSVSSDVPDQEIKRSAFTCRERREVFKVPRLMSEIQGTLANSLTPTCSWNPMTGHYSIIRQRDRTITNSRFIETAHSFEIDLDGNRITYQLLVERS